MITKYLKKQLGFPTSLFTYAELYLVLGTSSVNRNGLWFGSESTAASTL